MEAISAEGTVLEGLSLEDILKNVRDNNSWESSEWIEEERDLVSRVYEAYLLAVKTDIPTREIGKRYQFDVNTPKRWREKKEFPKQLRPYKRSFLPQNQKEREYFATLLGMLARVRVRSPLPKKTMTKKIPHKEALQKVGFMFETLTAGKARIKGEVISISNVKFLRTLDYSLETKFEQYVSNDEERVAFLRGIFSTTRSLGSGKSSRVWELSCGNVEITKKLLNSFLELDIYPRIYDEGDRIAIMSGVCLEKLCKLDIITNPAVREMVTPPGYVPATEISPQLYYEIRRKAHRRVKRDGKIRPETITDEVCRSSVYNKAYDGGEETSRAVKRYKGVIKFLGLPNVYEANRPVKRNNKWFFPLDGEIYMITSEMLEQYTALKRVYTDNGISFDDLSASLKSGNGHIEINVDNCRIVSFQPRLSGVMIW